MEAHAPRRKPLWRLALALILTGSLGLTPAACGAASSADLTEPLAAVYMRQDVRQDLTGDAASVNMIRQLELLGLRHLRISGEPANVLEQLRPGSTYISSGGAHVHGEVEDMRAVASFVKRGGMVVLLGSGDDDGEAAGMFISRVLGYQGAWTLCKRVSTSVRDHVGRSTLDMEHAHSFLLPLASAGGAAAADGGAWPAELEEAAVTHAHTWCHHQDASAVSWPLYTVADSELMVTAQVFGKAGVPGAVVWLGYNWRAGPQLEWGRLLKSLITGFASGSYPVPVQSNGHLHPLGASSARGGDADAFESSDQVVEAVADIVGSSADIVRRFLAAMPAAYPPPPSQFPLPSPSPSPSASPASPPPPPPPPPPSPPTPFCALASTTATVSSLNSGASACNPTSAASSSSCTASETCVAMLACQRWACDPSTQRLVQQPCSGLCQPRSLTLLSANIADDGRSVVVALSAAASPLALVACGSVFRAASAALLGGSGALCSVEGAVLTATLTPSATLTAGQPLSVLSSGSALVGQLDPTRNFSGTVTVTACANCVAPLPALTGPATITKPCVGDSALLAAAASQPPSFDASQSSDPSGRAAWASVQWSLPAGFGSAASRSVLQGAINRTNAVAATRDRLLLSLTAAEAASLEDAPVYRIQVLLTSWLGTTAAAAWSFSKQSSSNLPAVQVVGAAVQTFRISGGLRAAADGGALCNGQALEWRWSSNWTGLPAARAAQQQLYLPGPVAAVHGQSIVLRVAANYVGDASSAASASVTMLALGSLPLASLAGPAGDVPDDSPLLLNATASSDPDTSRAAQRLTFQWECRREDYPAPCFSGAAQGDQAASPGVWALPAGLLTNGKTHTITVRVSKQVAAGAPLLQATASLTFRPRSASEPFPRGALARQCAAAAACAAPHSTDKPLTVRLKLGSSYTAAAVTWASAELATLASLTVATHASDASIPAGTHLLTIPAAALPTNRASLTLTANLLLNGIAGEAILTVPLNGAPYCALSNATNSTTDAAAAAAGCLGLETLDDAYPTAAIMLRAQGWADDSDSQQLRYEFGVREERSNGRTVDTAQRIGSASSATLVGLKQGSVLLYGCAIDSQGSRACATQRVTVRGAAAGFDAAAAAASLNLTALAESNDMDTLLQAGSMLASLLQLAASASTSASVSQMAGRQTTALVSALLSTASMADPEQAQQLVAATSSLAASAASLLPNGARGSLLTAAQAAAAALPADSSLDFLSQICTLLGVSMPTSGTATAAAAAASSHRRALRAASSPSPSPSDSGSGAAALLARQRLRDLLAAADRLGDTLGGQAVPGGGAMAAGDSGLYVAAAVLVALPSGASANASSSLLLRSGPTAAAAGADPAGGRRRALLAAAAATDAEALLVLSGAAASAADGYGIDLQYAPAAGPALAAALASALPPSATLLSGGGLTTVTWNAPAAATSGAVAAAPPALDGAASYLQLRLPAPGLDPSKPTSCLSFNAADSSLSGALAGLAPSSSGAAPAASFVSYDSSTGLVTCRATAAGSYLVAQGAAPLSPATTTASSSPVLSSLLADGTPINNATQEQAAGSVSGGDGASTAAMRSLLGGVLGGIAGLVLLTLGALAVVVLRRSRSNQVGIEVRHEYDVVTYVPMPYGDAVLQQQLYPGQPRPGGAAGSGVAEATVVAVAPAPPRQARSHQPGHGVWAGSAQVVPASDWAEDPVLPYRLTRQRADLAPARQAW